MKPTLPTRSSRPLAVCVTLLSLFLTGWGQFDLAAQTLFQYTNASSGAPNFVAAGASSAGLALGTGTSPVVAAAPPCGAAQGFGAEKWPTTNVFNVNTFNTNGWFITFTLTPDAGNGLKINGFRAKSRRENLTGTDDDGPIALRYGYSTDGGTTWTTVNPGNPQSNNLCTSPGVERVWPALTSFTTSNPVIFRIYGLSSGANLTGDMYLRDVIVEGEVCANVPDIVLGSVPEHCFSNSPTAATIPYSSTTGTEYKLDIPGLGISTSYAALPASPISFTIPGATSAGTYPGTVTVRNTCGFEDPTPTMFSLVINPLPNATVGVDPSTICAGDPITITFNESAYSGGTEFTVSATASDDNGTGPVSYSAVINGDEVTWTEGADFTGTLVVGTVTVVNESNLCQSTTPGFTVLVNPLPTVTCPSDFEVCLSSGVLFLEALPGLSPPSVDASSSFSGTGVVPVSITNGWWDFQIGTAGVGTHTITYSYTDANNCTNSCDFDIKINPIPNIAATDITICSGDSTGLEVTNPNAVAGSTFNWVADYGAVTGGAGSATDVAFGSNAINETLTNPTSSPVVVTYTITPVGPAPTYCQGSPFDVFVTVQPAPVFKFSASSTSDLGGSVNNESGAADITIDFCAGNQLTLSGYDDNGPVGFVGNYVTSGNVSYDGGALGAGPVNFTIAPSGAASFFGNIYGGVLGYGLTSGTFGTIDQAFTPYLDVNGNDAYDPGIDCLGEPVTLHYHIYGPIVVNVVRNDNNLCSGELVDYTISTTSTEPILVDVQLSENTNGANPADLDDDNTLPVQILALNLSSASPHNFTQAIHNAMGTFDRGRVSISVTNVRYAGTDVSCGATVNNPQSNTLVYPKPRLVNPGDKLVCTGSGTDLDLLLMGLPSFNTGSAGFPVGVEWTVSAVSNISGAAAGNTVIYDNTGAVVGNLDQTLTLDDLSMPGSVTYTITPRASGPTNAFNGDDCFGDPITVTVTVVAPAEPTIEGPTCLHVGSEIELTGFDNVLSPASLVTADWADDGSGHVSVDANGVVTGISVGTSTVYYTVSDDAGCYATASYTVTVLDGLTLNSTYAGGSVVCGEEVTISVEVEGFCDINTMDYQFEWDENLFELVTFTTPYAPPGGSFFLTQPVSNGLYLSFFDDFLPPYGNEIPDGTVIMTYTLRALASTGAHNVPNVVLLEDAYNSSFGIVPMTTTGVTIPVAPISLTLGLNPVACPSDGVAHLTFSGLVGSPNYYYIDFDGCPGFPDTQEGLLDVNDGEIIIPFMPAFVQSGSCNATLVVSNTDTGCESDVYLFSIIIDPTPPTASNPAPVHVACLWQIPAPNPAVVIDEDDNCPGTLTVAYEPMLSSESGTGCAGNPKIILRVYSVTDQAGNSTTVTQLITAEDNLPPYLLEPPTLATWYGSEAAAVAAALAHANAKKQDNCSTAPQITVAQGTVPTYVGCTLTIPIVLTDACGNLATVNYTTIIDTQNPTVTAGPIDDCYDEADPGDPYGIFTYAVNAAIAATTATDDCDASLTITATVTGTDCSLTITVTATDDCGKSSSVVYNTRAENDAPNFSISTSIIEAMLFEECFTTEAEAEAAAIAIAKLYAGDDCTDPNLLQFDAFTNPGCPAEVMVIVTDYCGNPAMLTFYGVHIDDEDPTVDPDYIYETCYKTLAAAFAALADVANPEDNCTASSVLIDGATATYVEVGNFEDLCLEYDITLTFTDNCGRSVSHTFNSITIDNTAPTVTALPALTYNCVSELDAPDISSVVADDNCSVIDIQWIEDDLPTSCPGVGTRQYRVWDCAGNYTDVFQVININDDVAPTWVSVSNSLNRTPDCDDDLSILDALALEPLAEDNCGDFDVILVSEVPLNTCAGGWTRTWVVVDACGNQATAPFVQTITLVDDVEPEWVTPLYYNDTEVECDDSDGLADALAFQPVAEDNCSAVSYTLASRDYVAYVECVSNYLGHWVSEWVAEDACDNPSVSFFHYVYVYDNTAPVWSTPQGQPWPIGLDVSISCSDPASLAFANGLSPVATDNCDSDLIYDKVSGSFVSGACVGEGTITNTWTATDHCGNISTAFTQTITITDNTPPSFNPSCQFMPLTLRTSEGYACPSSATISGLSVGQEIDETYSWVVAGFNVPPLAGCIFDNCVPSSAIIVKVAAIENVYNPTNCSRTITLRFELRDPCGNVQPELFVCIYNIIDDVAPSVSPGSISTCYNSEAAAFAAAIAATAASDDCTLSGSLTKTASRTGTLCSSTVTVTVTDCAGNSASVNYNTRIDGQGPNMTAGILAACHPSIAAAQAAAIAATTITDNCTSYGDMMIVANTVGTCPATVTVTAIDQCGNSSSIAYPGLCIGSGSSVTITTPASAGSAVCEEVAGGIALWLANHGGATASGSGVTWSYAPADPLAALLSAEPNCTTHTKTVLVTFTATDGCGYTAITTAYFSVSDNTPPTANPIAPTNLTCSTGIPAPNIALVTGVSDNCGTPTVALFGNSDNGGAGCPGNPRIIVRTYSVTDQYCNTTYVTHTITVVDNVPPTFSAPANITINVDAGCVYNASPAVTGDVTDEMDNCSTGLNAVYTDNVTPGDAFQVKYVILRTWTLVDNCGNNAIPRTQTITVKDVTPPTLLGCPSGNVDLPGSLIEMGMCGAYAASLTNPLFSDNCPMPSISYSLSGATSGSGSGYVPGTLALAEGVTTVTYSVTDMAGNVVTCSFTVTVNCLSIEGRIIWEHDKASGVKDATVNVTRAAPAFAGSGLSNSNGNYNVAVPDAGTYTVKPVKNINRFNGVTSADVTAIQNHVAGIAVITDPYKKVCADVNRSGTITSQDATILSQALMGNPTALAIFNVFWRFVPTDFAMPATPPANVPAFPEQKNVTLTTMDAVGIDFYGMKIGDVAAPWADPQMKPNLQPLVWTVYDQALVAGTEVDVTFTASNFADLSSYIMGLDFDPSVLKFVGFQPLGALPMNLNDNFGAFNADLGELRHIWASTQGTSLADGTQVFRAKFKVLRSGQKLSQVLRLDESEIECKAYYADPLMPVEMKLVFVESVNTGSPVDPSKLSLQLLQNRPNPFTDRTVIGFILPEACNAQIRILDISGRELANYDRQYSAGYHELEFRLANAALYGILYCELTTPQGTRSIKMIAVH